MDTSNLRKVDIIFSKVDNPLQILDKALQKSPDDIINEIIDSGLKGRGGAGFPTGLKWKFTKNEDSDIKYVICNADEGEPGTFKDRQIIEEVPEKIFIGMALAAYCIDAKEAYMYLRGEYNFFKKDLLSKM